MSNNSVLGRFEEYFKTHAIKYKREKDDKILVAVFAIDSKIGNIKEYIYAREDSYTVRAQCALHADSECRMRMAEYLMRANYGLILGNFEMDFEDGEILYKVTQNLGEDIPTEQDVENSVIMPLAMFSRYGDGIIKVAFSLATPEEAIKEAESIEYQDEDDE